MTKTMLGVALGSLVLAFPSATAWAGSASVPNTFQPNTTARAAEVNANFVELETEVNDNDARITSFNSSKQDRVTGSCAVGSSIRQINVDGSVACETDSSGSGDITSVTAGTGLSGGGTSGAVTLSANTNVVQARVTSSCAAGSSIRQINSNGTVACQTDVVGTGDITGVSAGTGLTGGGTSGSVTLSANTNVVQSRVSGTCAVGSSIRQINANGSVTCEPGSPSPNLIVWGAGQQTYFDKSIFRIVATYADHVTFESTGSTFLAYTLESANGTGSTFGFVSQPNNSFTANFGGPGSVIRISISDHGSWWEYACQRITSNAAQCVEVIDGG